MLGRYIWGLTRCVSKTIVKSVEFESMKMQFITIRYPRRGRRLKVTKAAKDGFSHVVLLVEWLAGKRRICWFLAGSLLEIHAQGLSHVDSFDPAGGRWHFGWFLAPAYHCPTHWYGNRHGGNGMEWSSNPYISSVMFCVYTPIFAIICKQSQQGQWDCPLRQRSLYNWQVEYSGMHRYTGLYVVIVHTSSYRNVCFLCSVLLLPRKKIPKSFKPSDLFLYPQYDGGICCNTDKLQMHV